MSRMPNFLVLGAAKAGTTSLFRYLKQHPEIYMSPQKEPRFFALEGQKIDFRGPGDMTRFNFVTDIDQYRRLFAGVTSETAIGEVSPWYLYVPQAAERIKHHVPHAKLIAVLRDPVDRAYSNFMHAVREKIETVDSFEEAMEAEAERIAQKWSYRWHYRQKGFYFPQVKRYMDMFGREQIRVYLFEDLKSDPAGMLQDIFRFLEVDDSFEPDVTKKFNVSNLTRSDILSKALKEPNRITPIVGKLIPSRELKKSIKRKLRRYNSKPAPKLAASARRKYVSEYRDDVLKLQDLLRRDLSKWLN